MSGNNERFVKLTKKERAELLKEAQRKKLMKVYRPPQTTERKKTWKNRGPVEKKKAEKEKERPQKNTVTPSTKAKSTAKDPRFSQALGQRNNIMVTPVISASAVLGYPIGILIHAMTKGFINSNGKPLYAAYTVMIDDFLKRAAGATPPLKSRLKYVHTLLQSFEPKEIVFKQGTISYAWEGLSSVTPAPLYTVRNFNTALYVQGNTNLDGWEVFIPPPVLSIDDSLPVYSEAMALLNDSSRKCLTFEESTEITDLTRDVSGYAGNTAYYGAGNTPQLSGPFSSIELEVPFKARAMGVFTGYNQAATKRVSRNLEVTSGDSCSNFGFPFVSVIRDDFYRNAVPTIYCYIDLDEVCYYLQAWYFALVGKIRQNTNLDGLEDVLQPFNNSAQAFRIAVRQCVLSYFADQATVQFLTYSNDSNGFEPFRCGTNCFPLQRVENQMRMPIALIENLRMLQTKVYSYCTKKYDVPRNKIVYKPVWGIYKSTINAPVNVIGELLVESWSLTSLFNFNVNVNDPNPIDGFKNGTCLNMNSANVDVLITEWNLRVERMSAVSTTTGVLGSSSRGSLLPYCRFVNYFEGDQKITSYPKILRNTLHPEFIKRLPVTNYSNAPINTNDKFKFSGGVATPPSIDKYEEYYVPPQFSLHRQQTQSFSSFYPITDSAISILNQLIIPSYFVEEVDPPTQQQIRVSTMTAYVEVVKNSSNISKSRAAILDQVALLSAPGIGASNNTDEFIASVKAMSEADQGGFLGDLIAAVAPLATNLPF